jgi:hypothetical protein
MFQPCSLESAGNLTEEPPKKKQKEKHGHQIHLLKATNIKDES